MNKKLFVAGVLALAVSTSVGVATSHARPGDISPAGMRGAWHSTRIIEPYNGALYTVENGTLYATYANGVFRQLGVKNDYQGTIDLTAAYGDLYLTDNDRTLYRILPDGRRRQVSDRGVFNVRYMTVLDGELFGIEDDGTLYRVSREGALTQVGPAGGWQKTQMLVAFKGQLWTIDRGTLYHADREVKWKQVGPIGAWKSADFMVPLHNNIWMVAHGDLFSLDSNGRKKLVARSRWRNVVAMTVFNGKLLSVENNGRMFITATR